MPRVLGVCLAALLRGARRRRGGAAPPTASSTRFDPASAQRLRAAAAADRARRRRRLPRAARRPLGRRQPGGARGLGGARVRRRRRRTPHAAALVLGFLDEVALDRLGLPPLDGYGVSLALPFAAARPARGRGGRRAALEPRRLADRAHPPLRRRGQTRAWHDAAARADAGTGRRPTAGARPGCMITAGVLRDGRHFFTRSDRDRRGLEPPSTSPAAPTTPPR